MKLRRTISKILALGTGAVMVGATILSATAAADLKDYPSPFVQDGKFNAIIVVGDTAMSSDVIGSVDIATSLQYASKVQKTVTSTGGGSVAINGEAWRVGSGSKKLEFSETLTAGTNQETINNVTTFIGKDELPTLLAPGTFSNTQGDYDYRQYLYFDANPAHTTGTSNSVMYAKNNDDKAADYFFVKDSEEIGRYQLEFTEAAKSDITDNAGAVSATGGYLWNFEGKSIKMLGRDWSIVKARTDTDAVHHTVELTLMGGATKDVLSEGDSKTYTIGGKEYDLSLDFVGATSAKFTINGEVTDSLAKGATQTLKDGTQLGIRDIVSQDFAGGVRKVEFYLGADKVVFKDTNFSSASDGATSLVVGSDTISGSTVTIGATATTTSLSLNTIAINTTADDSLYVPAGGSVSAQMSKPQALLNSWDIQYGGLEPTATENIKINPSGSTQYNLEFVNGNGDKVSLPLTYTSGTTVLKLGTSDYDLILNENQSVSKNDYFVVSDYSQRQGERKTFAYRYLSALKSTESSPQITLKDLGSGTETKIDYSAKAGAAGSAGNADATLKVGGSTFNIWNASADTSAGFDLAIDMNANGALDNSFDSGTAMNITTYGGAQIVLEPSATMNASGTGSASATGGSLGVSIQSVDSKDYDNLVPTPIRADITATAGKVDLGESTKTPRLSLVTSGDNSDVKNAYTSLGAFVTWNTASSDSDTLTVEYPINGQRLPIVLVSAPGASVSASSGSEGGQLTYYETTPIAVGSAKLATDVADIKAQNAIVVGGPCANAAAATLLGNPQPCYGGFTEGKGMLKLFENNGKVAILVAGASAMDTRIASRVLADYTKYQELGVLKGTAVEVAGTSFTDITVSAPAVPVATTTTTTTSTTTTTTDNTTTTTQ